MLRTRLTERFRLAHPVVRQWRSSAAASSLRPLRTLQSQATDRWYSSEAELRKRS
jgi:hypothetical protein